MKTVFRVETAMGKGPYFGMGYAWCVRNHGWESPFAPAPENDGLKGFTMGFAFGFKTFKQFKKWFACPKELVNLHKMGYKLSIYKVNQAQLQTGRSQVAFNYYAAKKVTAISLERVAKKLTTVKKKPKSEIEDDIAF